MTRKELFSDFTESLGQLTASYKTNIRKRFKEHNIDLTTEMLQVLRFLWMKDAVKQQEIADSIHKDKTSLTYLIDNLTRRGLLERKEDSTDRRNKIIVLTEKGKQLQTLIEPWIEELFDSAVVHVSKEELETAIRVFRAVNKGLA